MFLAAAAITTTGSLIAADQEGDAQESARQATAQQMALAQEQLSAAQDSYNALIKKRPGTKFKQWKKAYLQGITDPDLKREIRALREEDMATAREEASRFSNSNLSDFMRLAEVISGGRFGSTLNDKFSSIGQEDINARYESALRLASPAIAADTNVSKSGLSRGQKRLFGVAFDIEEKSRDKQSAIRDQIINMVSSIASSQQEKGRDFINQTSLEGTLGKIGLAPLEAKMANQRLDEQRQFSMIDALSRAASGLQPVAAAASPLSSVNWSEIGTSLVGAYDGYQKRQPKTGAA
jgi:hypothetical protein